MASVLIVVLNWNGAKDTQKCVASLLDQSYRFFDILVVDNGSKDNSVPILEKLANKHKKVTLVKNPKNLGFAGGVNTGIRYALENKYQYVALFNNDATADKKWLKSLVDAMDDDRAITTGLLLHANKKTIDSTGDFYSIWGMPFPRSRGDKATQIPESGEVFSASGGASLYKAELFREIGLFDESFFAYYEDVDMSFRTQLIGHKVYYTNKAIAYHKQGATSSKLPGFTVYQTFKNIPLLFAKNVPVGLLIPIGIRLLLLYVLMFGNALRKGSGWPAFKGWLASIWYFWTRALWDRFFIQSYKNVPFTYINRMIHHDLPPDQTGMRKFRSFFTGK